MSADGMRRTILWTEIAGALKQDFPGLEIPSKCGPNMARLVGNIVQSLAAIPIAAPLSIADHARALIDASGLTVDQKHMGVVVSEIRPPHLAGKGDANRVSANAYDHHASITVGIFVGDHTWCETEITADEADRFAAILMHKAANMRARLTVTVQP